MNAMETLGFFWVVLATAMFTATVLIAASYSIYIGVKTAYRWLRSGQHQEAEDLEFRRIARGA